MKNKTLMIIFTILVFLLFMGIVYFVYTMSNTDAVKFKREYESLNNVQIENSDKKHRKISIPSNNPFIYKTEDEIVKMMNNKETFIVYFGFNKCPWCRSVLPTLIEVANDYNIETIYYVDILEIRDILNVDDEGNLITERMGTKGYYKLLELFDNVLDDYALEDKDGNNVITNEKRIYAPNIVGVVNGKAEKLTTGISDIQEEAQDAFMEISDEMKKDSYSKIECIIKCINEKNKTCTLEKAC